MPQISPFNDNLSKAETNISLDLCLLTITNKKIKRLTDCIDK